MGKMIDYRRASNKFMSNSRRNVWVFLANLFAYVVASIASATFYMAFLDKNWLAFLSRLDEPMYHTLLLFMVGMVMWYAALPWLLVVIFCRMFKLTHVFFYGLAGLILGFTSATYMAGHGPYTDRSQAMLFAGLLGGIVFWLFGGFMKSALDEG